MRKALIPAFLLVVAAIVLGSTVFREQIVSAATTPFQSVVVQNTNTNPIPVTQVGTSTTSVSGTVGLDPGQNTVKLDSTANTVKLDSADSTHLSDIEGELSNLKFDGGGNLETTAPTTSPEAVSQVCFRPLDSSVFTVPNDSQAHTLCSFDDYLTNVTAHGMDDNLFVQFFYKGKEVLELAGTGGIGSGAGSADWQMDLSHPIHVDTIEAFCANSSTDCNFSMLLLGNSTGS
jgi:mRNA-degrading endonuclease toxin of MazEF toxin-antitoxin module